MIAESREDQQVAQAEAPAVLEAPADEPGGLFVRKKKSKAVDGSDHQFKVKQTKPHRRCHIPHGT